VSAGAVRPEVRLAGEIADQFRRKPDHEAAEVVAHHIRLFWDPRMRAGLLAARTAGEIDDPIVLLAAAALQG
jgi:formate dehydrogenase subunit delta